MKNDFLSAEERIRLKCVFLHSEKIIYAPYAELSHEEVGFVLCFSTQYAQQIEKQALNKLKNYPIFRSLIENFNLEEWV